jgi:hypothetical protein
MPAGEKGVYFRGTVLVGYPQGRVWIYREALVIGKESLIELEMV